MRGLNVGVSRIRPILIFLGICVIGFFGYWLAGTASMPESARSSVRETAVVREVAVSADDPMPKFRQGKRVPAYRRDDEAIANGALSGQRILVFNDRESLGNFLKRAGENIRVMGRLDALNALRVSFLNPDDLAGLLDGQEQASLVYPVDVPTYGEGAVQDSAVALGAGLLEWLGIAGDNSQWGAGVRVAILDTGVTSSPAFSSNISWINLTELPADRSKQNGHGTAVASMIIGQNPLTPGVAPGSEIISVRIANDLGQSDSFTLSQGIVAAVDAGAQLINISMGSFGDSVLVRNALEYARAAGALIIASTGNNGTDRVTYPAANAGVIAVGAVDAVGNHLNFSNTGSQVSIAAPGFGVNAAWTGDQAAKVNGTSFSSPIVTGAIAALMSQPGNARLTARQATDLLYAYLNDTGAAGSDTQVGAGLPDLGRAINGRTAGIYDAAVASQRIIPADKSNPNGQLEVLVQNRGTETLVNTKVQINTPGGTVNTNITTLPANAVRTIRIPINGTADGKGYDSTVSLSGGRKDVKPSNDHRSETYVPPVSK